MLYRPVNLFLWGGFSVSSRAYLVETRRVCVGIYPHNIYPLVWVYVMWVYTPTLHPGLRESENIHEVRCQARSVMLWSVLIIQCSVMVDRRDCDQKRATYGQNSAAIPAQRISNSKKSVKMSANCLYL